MIQEVLLKTKGMFDDKKGETDYELWNDIAEFMDGEKAAVVDSSSMPGKYIFLCLIDEEKNKELFYKMEQDSMFGIFIDDREGFDHAWDERKYEPDGMFVLEKEYMQFSKEQQDKKKPIRIQNWKAAFMRTFLGGRA